MKKFYMFIFVFVISLFIPFSVYAFPNTLEELFPLPQDGHKYYFLMVSNSGNQSYVVTCDNLSVRSYSDTDCKLVCSSAYNYYQYDNVKWNLLSSGSSSQNVVSIYFEIPWYEKGYYSNTPLYLNGVLVATYLPDMQSSFDGSISVDGYTVRNSHRYVDDLIYNISFSSDLANQFTSSIWNGITQIRLNYYYDLQVPSYSWLVAQSEIIDSNYGGSFDSWYSFNSSFSQLLVCNSYVSYLVNPADHRLSKDNDFFGIDTNLSSYAADIYGNDLTFNQQKLFDVCTYVRTVGVRLRWLLSDLFGYGPLHIINIGPTLLNGRAISNNSFGGVATTDGSNDYFYNQNNIPIIDFNDIDNVVSSVDYTNVYYPNQNVIVNNYNVYNNYLNYYPVVSSPGIQNVYVVNYKDFLSSDIFHNYDFDFDVNITDSANSLTSLGSIFENVSSGDLSLISDDSESKEVFSGIFNGLPIEITTLFVTVFILLVVVGVINRLLG